MPQDDHLTLLQWLKFRALRAVKGFARAGKVRLYVHAKNFASRKFNIHWEAYIMLLWDIYQYRMRLRECVAALKKGPQTEETKEIIYLSELLLKDPK